MKRDEVELEKAIWHIPAERMKMRRPHDIPLSKQAIEILKKVWPFNEQHSLVFPSLRSHEKPLSENAFNSVLKHGIRQGPGHRSRLPLHCKHDIE